MNPRRLAPLLVFVLLAGCMQHSAPRTKGKHTTPTSTPYLAANPATVARVLELKNGTVFVDVTTREEGGKLYVQDPLLGSLVIDASAVGHPSGPVDSSRFILLKNKSRLIGTVTKEEAGKVYVDADLIGPVLLDAAVVSPRGR